MNYIRIWIIALSVLIVSCQTNVMSDSQLLAFVDVNDIRGKSVEKQMVFEKHTVIVFFDLSCIHCVDMLSAITRTELPLKYSNEVNFVFVGRGHEEIDLINLEIVRFSNVFVVADPRRDIFNNFAKENVPRTYFFNERRSLVLSNMGWAESDDISLKRLEYQINLLIGKASVST